MANNRELSQFADFLNIDESGNNNVGIATTVRISGGGGVYVGGIEVISPTGVWKGPGSGLIGAQGSQGTAGAQGAQGSTGPTGAQGAQGVSGTLGTTGPTGPTGAQGAAGSQGAIGAQGAEGSASAVIPAGTVMLFWQAAAPTGWTQVTTQTNKALRVVSGTGGGTGGTTAFTSVFASRTPAGTVTMTNAAVTLSEAQIPSHTHSESAGSAGTNADVYDGNQAGGTTYSGNTGTTTGATGGGESHTHANTASFSGTALDFAVQYIDIILCSKN